MTPRRRFAQGSSTGAHRLQNAAVRSVTAHQQLQAAARRVTSTLDDAVPIECADDESLAIVIDRARHSVAPRAR